MGRKSAKIATRKGAADKARGRLYSKTLKDVFLASKKGGADVGTNFLLRVAVERCKKFNVPKDLIDKAIKKGQGSDGVGYEEVSYEGYGPSGVAIFVETSTNNPDANGRQHQKLFQQIRRLGGSDRLAQVHFRPQSGF
jgi:transcriptional/translational regulatory protein YebC/TACO1